MRVSGHCQQQSASIRVKLGQVMQLREDDRYICETQFLGGLLHVLVDVVINLAWRALCSSKYLQKRHGYGLSFVILFL